MIRQTLFIFKVTNPFPMKKSDFLERIEKTHRAYRDVLGKITNKQLLDLHTCGDWSVKDVIAHVTWYEQQMVGLLETRSLKGSELWNLSLEERNRAIHAENQNRSLEDILKKGIEIHKTLMDLIQSLSEDDLQKAENFKDMPSEWIPWEVIASNTFEHYPEHTAAIQEVLAKSKT